MRLTKMISELTEILDEIGDTDVEIGSVGERYDSFDKVEYIYYHNGRNTTIIE